jgi:hypothetical protein
MAGLISGAEHPLQTTVEVGAEFLVRRDRGRGQSPDDQLAAGRQPVEPLATQVPEASLDPMTDHGVADGAADHESDPSREVRIVVGVVEQMQDECVTATAGAST